MFPACDRSETKLFPDYSSTEGQIKVWHTAAKIHGRYSLPNLPLTSNVANLSAFLLYDPPL